MKSFRSVLLSWPFLVVVTYLVVGLAFVGLGYIGSAGGADLMRAIPMGVALFFVVAIGVIWVLAFEEDWWNDFRETNAALAVAAACQFLVLPAAWFLGWSLG